MFSPETLISATTRAGHGGVRLTVTCQAETALRLATTSPATRGE
jgi:hypothetical protein